MYIESASRYKSWGGLKKQMNALLCNALKDRISYFYTKCHGNEFLREDGKAAICLDKKEISVFSSGVKYAVQMPDFLERCEKCDFLSDGDRNGEEYSAITSALLKEKWMIDGSLCEEDFVASMTIYLQTDIATALCSDNYLLRVFAYLDRRVGKKTLIRIKDEVSTLPEWVKQFYDIRCAAEGIAFSSGSERLQV